MVKDNNRWDGRDWYTVIISAIALGGLGLLAPLFFVPLPIVGLLVLTGALIGAALGVNQVLKVKSERNNPNLRIKQPQSRLYEKAREMGLNPEPEREPIPTQEPAEISQVAALKKRDDASRSAADTSQSR